MAYEHHSTYRVQPAVHGDDRARENSKENERTTDLKTASKLVEGDGRDQVRELK